MINAKKLKIILLKWQSAIILMGLYLKINCKNLINIVYNTKFLFFMRRGEWESIKRKKPEGPPRLKMVMVVN